MLGPVSRAKTSRSNRRKGKKALTDKYLPELEERFVRYVQIDTMADETSPTSPSTAKQYDLINLLADELREIGAQDVRVTDYGAVIATIPGRGANAVSAPTVAFLAHVDTIPGFSGTGVRSIATTMAAPCIYPTRPVSCSRRRLRSTWPTSLVTTSSPPAEAPS
jgi:hypothetical protein